MVTIGRVVVTIDALIGEVSDIPIINTPWFMIIASRAATAINLMSEKGTRSFLKKNEVIQNAMAAPITRNDTSVHELTSGFAITTFDKGAINPHEILAAIIAECPLILSPFTCEFFCKITRYMIC